MLYYSRLALDLIVIIQCLLYCPFFYIELAHFHYLLKTNKLKKRKTEGGGEPDQIGWERG